MATPFPAWLKLTFSPAKLTTGFYFKYIFLIAVVSGSWWLLQMVLLRVFSENQEISEKLHRMEKTPEKMSTIILAC